MIEGRRRQQDRRDNDDDDVKMITSVDCIPTASSFYDYILPTKSSSFSRCMVLLHEGSSSSSSSSNNNYSDDPKIPPVKMKRPLLDQLATTLFKLESQRVEASSIIDEQGRYGEPMEWSNITSFANQFSVMIASNPIGYAFKQTVANLVAGNYNEDDVTLKINNYIQQDTVVMFSFTTCPFCRKAKDILNERNVQYTTIELDTLDDGNILRAQLGKITKRTSMPNIYIQQKCIGGCNDGYPGLVPLIESNQLDALLSTSSS